MLVETLLLSLVLAVEKVPRPAPSAGQEKAPPGTPNVICESTKGPFRIEMHPEWSPLGAEQFLAAVKDGVYDGTCIYRVVKNEAVQFGIPKDPEVRKRWRKRRIKDDAQIFRDPNWHRGMISFAGGGPNTRGTDLFISFKTWNANGTPRAPWETPFGIIDEEGLTAVTNFTAEYGDLSGFGGHAPDLSQGYSKLKDTHPNIDFLGKCSLVFPATAAVKKAKQRITHMKHNAFGRQHGVKVQLVDASKTADATLRSDLISHEAAAAQ